MSIIFTKRITLIMISDLHLFWFLTIDNQILREDSMGMETAVVGAHGLAPPTDREPPNVTPDDKFWLGPFWIEVQM